MALAAPRVAAQPVPWSAPAALNSTAATDTGMDWRGHMATDRAGVWVTVWDSTENLNGTAGTDYDILFSRSTDDGQTWSPVAALNTNATSDTGNDTRANIATDRSGVWIVAWRTTENLGGIGTDGDILFARSTDAGQTWSAPAVLNSNATSDTGDDAVPWLATDGAHRWVAIWSSTENLGGTAGADYDIFVSRSTDDGQTWTAPALLNNNATADTGSDDMPHLATDGAGHWVALWRSDENLGGTAGTDRDIFVSRSTDKGQTWSGPEPLNTNATSDSGADHYPKVVTDGAGHWVAVWSSTENLNGAGVDEDPFVSCSTDNGQTWTAPAFLKVTAALDGYTDTNPNLATDGAGNWIAAWEADVLNPDIELLYTRSFDNGQSWTTPTLLNTSASSDTGHDRSPCLVTDGAGHWVALWYSKAPESGLGDDQDIFFATAYVPTAAQHTVIFQTDGTPGATLTGDTTQYPVDGGDCTTVTANAPTGYHFVKWTRGAADFSTDNPLVVTNVTQDMTLVAHFASDRQFTVVFETDGTPGATLTGVTTQVVDYAVDCSPVMANEPASHHFLKWTRDGADYSTDNPLTVTNVTEDMTLVAVYDVIRYAVAFQTDGTPGASLDGDAMQNVEHGGNCTTVTAIAPQYQRFFRWTRADAPFSTANPLVVTNVTQDTTLTAIFALDWRPVAALNTNAATDVGDDQAVQLATDGEGVWVAVWYSDDPMGGTVSIDPDIFFARSTDNGQTWSAPAALNTNAFSDPGSDYSPSIATDGAGLWVVVWNSNQLLAGGLGADYDILFARSTDNGQSWSAPATLDANATSDTGNDGSARVATDRAGNWIVAWESDDSQGGAIGPDYDILFARSTDGGQSWSAPSALNTNATSDTGEDYSPDLATDGAGAWVAVWDSDENLGGVIGDDHDIIVARSADSGQTWSTPGLLNSSGASDGSATDRFPRLATDGAGVWVAAWNSNANLGGVSGGDFDIFCAHSTDNGQSWTPTALLNADAVGDSSQDGRVALATDGAGGWFAVWQANENLFESPGTDYEIFFARSTDSGQTWRAPATLNANAATDSRDDEHPAIASDGAGAWVAAWQSTDDLGGTIGTDYDLLYSTGRLPIDAQYTVVFETDGTPGATLDGELLQVVNHRADCASVTANAPDGYRFVKWTKGGVDYSTANPLTVRDVTRDMTLVAVFAIDYVERLRRYLLGMGGDTAGLDLNSDGVVDVGDLVTAIAQDGL